MSESPDIAMLLDDHEFGDSPTSGGGNGGDAAGGGGGSGAAAGGDGMQPKRTRVLLSCAPCRVSKLKCDRESPCGNCLKKDRSDLCEYAPRPRKPAKPAKGMAARLRRLEGMLREMMDDDSAAATMSSFGVSSAELLLGDSGGKNSSGGGGGQPGATDAPPSLMATLADAEAEGYDGTGKPIPISATTSTAAAVGAAAEKPMAQHHGRGKGRVVHGQRATTYVGATHFMAMLDDIEDLKAYFDDPEEALDDDQLEVSAEADSLGHLILCGQQPRSKMDLLALMPPRNVVDRLIARYFGSNTPSQQTVHRPSFTREYKKFWQDPVSANGDFIAVLFIIMALGVHFSTFVAPQELGLDGTAMTPAERYRLYRATASGALVLTRFSNPNLRTIQALLMFTESEFLTNHANQTHCFLLLAVCIRLMLKMGLHRDASRLPNISAFEGEIRRRLWNMAIQMDLIVSFHLGLPSMIHGIPSDTSLAHNLLDEDFDEDSPVLPPPRPDSEYTVMSYPIFKSMVCRIFGQVARLAHTLTPPLYAEVLRTDRLLGDKWRQIPDFMKVRPLGDCVADPPMQVVQRFGLASLYQKSRCVLHRPYLVEAVPLPEHAYSRRTCLQSALMLLAYHEAVHEATQPGGLLYHIGWFITGMGMHDFLVAAMIVYLVVQNDNLFEPELLTGAAHSSGGMSTVSSAMTASTISFSGKSISGASGGGSAATTATTAAASTGDGTAALDDYDSRATLPADRSALIELLRRSHHIWADVSEKIRETTKAADVISVMLRKIYLRELRENGSPPDWSPPVDHRQEESAAQQQQQRKRSQPPPPSHQPSRQSSQPHATSQGNTNSNRPSNAGSNAMCGVPPLSQSTLRSLVQDPLLPAHLSGITPAADAAASLADAQISFSRRDLVPPSQLPAGATNNMAGPSRYDSWISLSLDTVDWGNVDTGIRVSSSHETEWATDNSVLDDINFAAASMWDQTDAAFQ